MVDGHVWLARDEVRVDSGLHHLTVLHALLVGLHHIHIGGKCVGVSNILVNLEMYVTKEA